MKCEPTFFASYTASNPLQSTFKIERSHLLIDSSCSYYCDFKFGRGIPTNNKIYLPLFEIKGIIFEKQNAILIIPNGFKDEIKFFDFSLKKGESEAVSLKCKALGLRGDSIIFTWNYNLLLEEKFYDSKLMDSIFKFRFNGISVYTDNDDLVLFLSKNFGLLGGYNALRDPDRDCVLSYIGNIYRERLDTIRCGSLK